jgi:RNA polymerase sigma-70 factor (ECF subfamily)
MAARFVQPSSASTAPCAGSRPSASSPAFPESLLSACLHGDEAAWERLFHATSPTIAAICRQEFHLHREDTEDVVQVVHLKLYGHLDELREGAAFSAWLRRVTRRTVIDMLRQKHQAVSLEALAEETGLEAPDRGSWENQWSGSSGRLPEGDMRVAVRLDVRRALSSLPPLYREPIIYYLVEGKGQDEIGRLLHRPRSTVATQIQRGLEKLRCQLGEAYAESLAAA